VKPVAINKSSIRNWAIAKIGFSFITIVIGNLTAICDQIAVDQNLNKNRFFRCHERNRVSGLSKFMFLEKLQAS